MHLSSSSNPGIEKKGLYYGWIVLAALLITGIAILGIKLSFGVFFKSLQEDFGWSRATTSGVFSFYMLLYCVFTVLGGWAIDRYGAKIVLTVMGFFTGLSLLLTSQASTPWHLFLSYSLLLAIGTAPIYILVMSTASRWFTGRRGLALGIASCGTGLGIMIMTPFSAWLISSYGWRMSYFILALIAFFVIIPCAQLVKRAPGELAALSEGEKLEATNLNSPEGQHSNEAGEFSLRQSVKTKSFWLIFSIWLLGSFCVYIVMTHIVSHAIDLGITSLRAASILTLIGGTSIPGGVLMGRVSDSLGRKQAAIICVLLMAGTMLWLIQLPNLWMLYLFAMVFGFFSGGFGPCIAALVGDIFGMRHVGVILGAINVGWAAGAAIGPALAGYIFDVKGSYFLAFLAGVIVMLIAAILIPFLKTPKTGGRVT